MAEANRSKSSLFPCEPNTVSANASSRHNSSTDEKPVQKVITIQHLSEEKHAGQIGCQMERQPRLTFILEIFSPTQKLGCTDPAQNART
jgi:hypothetical protein